MLVSYLWLSELVDINGATPEDVTHKLTDLGLEASIVDDRRDWYDGIVVGKVLTVEKHPDADKLNLTTVDVGDDEPKKIVCGASNVAEGILVVVALTGTVMPDGMKIESRKVRGEVSDGMICSESELKLSEDHAGIMILDDGATPGQLFKERYEVCDVVIEVDLTPNRGDCASMIGVARDFGAKLGSSLKKPVNDIVENSVSTSSMISLDIKAPDLCPRYSARVLLGATIKPSPFWMRRRLAAVGVRSINNIVDITNYVLMETGHPLHAFDYHNVHNAQIVVRRADDNEQFTTLDGKEHNLDSENLVIADGGGKPVALAGVMGGQNSEVSDTTKDILLESAFFNPASIRRTARKLSISSESSYRFERGTDIEGLIYAQDRAACLIADLGGAEVTAGRVDNYPEVHHKRHIVTLRFDRLNSIVGHEVDRDEAISILNGLELETEEDHGDRCDFVIPTHRWDLDREIDLIEEVARFVGYNTIESVIPYVPAADVAESASMSIRRSVRNHLRSKGMMEGLSLSFMNESDMDKLMASADHSIRRAVAIDNPISLDMSHLRTTLIHHMVSAGADANDLALFEVGAIFLDSGASTVEERWRLAGVLTESGRPSLYGGRLGERDFYDAKGVVESLISSLHFGDVISFAPSNEPYLYPKRQASVMVAGRNVGVVGQVHPTTLEAYDASSEMFVFEIDLTGLASIETPTVKSEKLSRYPSVKRDLAVVAPEDVTIGSVMSSIRKNGGASVSSVDLFDIFRSDKIGADVKSLAFSLEFRDNYKTMTDDEVDSLFNKIVTGLKEELNASLR